MLPERKEEVAGMCFLLEWEKTSLENISAGTNSVSESCGVKQVSYTVFQNPYIFSLENQ